MYFHQGFKFVNIQKMIYFHFFNISNFEKINYVEVLLWKWIIPIYLKRFLNICLMHKRQWAMKSINNMVFVLHVHVC
jgi:hypothetical protein